MLRDVGGYRATYDLLEDWDLFARVIMAGGRLAVIPKVLVQMRAPQDMNRSHVEAVSYVITETRFRTFLLLNGYLAPGEFAISTVAYAFFRLAGVPVRARLYRLVRRPTLSG